MHIASDILLDGFFDLKTFTLRSIPLTCHSARNRRWSRRIHHPKDNPCPPGEGGPSQTKVGEGQTKTLSYNPHPLWRVSSPEGEGFPPLFKMWILQLRASPACRMTWGWGERLEQKTSSLKCAATNGTKWITFVLYQRHESIKNQFT